VTGMCWLRILGTFLLAELIQLRLELLQFTHLRSWMRNLVGGGWVVLAAAFSFRIGRALALSSTRPGSLDGSLEANWTNLVN
jgi:hypothetical protein